MLDVTLFRFQTPLAKPETSTAHHHYEDDDDDDDGRHHHPHSHLPVILITAFILLHRSPAEDRRHVLYQMFWSPEAVRQRRWVGLGFGLSRFRLQGWRFRVLWDFGFGV